MKKLFLTLFSFISLLAFSQDISDVSQSSNGKLIVRDSKNTEISWKWLESGDELSGFSSYIVVIKTKSNKVKVYDQKLKEISWKWIESGDIVKNVNGNNILIRTKQGKIITYDKNLKEISWRWE